MSFKRSLNGGLFQPGQMVLPLLGERAGVRANFIFNCIVTPKGGTPYIFIVRSSGFSQALAGSLAYWWEPESCLLFICRWTKK